MNCLPELLSWMDSSDVPLNCVLRWRRGGSVSVSLPPRRGPARWLSRRQCRLLGNALHGELWAVAHTADAVLIVIVNGRLAGVFVDAPWEPVPPAIAMVA